MFVHPETGQITGTLNEGDRILKSSQCEYMDTHELHFNKNARFVKLYRGAALELYKALTPSEFAVFIQLLDYVGYDSLLKDEKKLLCMHDIAERLGISYSNIRKIMPKLVKKGVLATVYIEKKQKCYVVNPYIAFCGKDVEKSTLQIFKNSGWRERLN